MGRFRDSYGHPFIEIIRRLTSISKDDSNQQGTPQYEHSESEGVKVGG